MFRYLIGITTCCSILEYGSESNILNRQLQAEDDITVETPNEESEEPNTPSLEYAQALTFAMEIYRIVVPLDEDYILAYLHTQLVFIYGIAKETSATAHLQNEIPWDLTAMRLNKIQDLRDSEPHKTDDSFPRARNGKSTRPLPEDYAMRGTIWSKGLFPEGWFDGTFEVVERNTEDLSVMNQRRERILRLGRKIATFGKWLIWNAEEDQFSVPGAHNVDQGHMPGSLSDTE